MRFKIAVTAALVAALAVASVASAHIKLDPAQAPAGSDSHFAIVVLSEDPASPTTKVTVKIPLPVASVAFEAKPGWKRTVTVEKLVKPVVLDGETIKSRISTVTWTASGSTIAPGEFAVFSILVAVPDKAGAKLAFPTVQTYANGKVVRWIGRADADLPAPVLTVGAAPKGGA